MDQTFDEALKRLSEVVDELTRVPTDDFPRRDALMRERDRLRTRLADLRGDVDPHAGRSTDDLAAELKALEASAAELRKHRIDPVRQAGGGTGYGGEMGNLGAIEINRRITESTGLGDLERRIQRLRAVIADRRAGDS